MDGDGCEPLEQRRGSAAADLPSVLAQLDDRDPAVQRDAVRTIRGSLDDQPEAYVPTVPKLRTLLGRSAIDFHDEIAYCLAELASESSADVAPSVDEIVSFAVDNESAAATRELFRCLAAVAEDRPDAVVDHATAIAGVLERRQGYDPWGLRLLGTLSAAYPTAVEAAVPVLTDAIATAPESNGVPALSALGRIARSDASPSSFAFVDYALELVDHDDPSLRNNAIGCLGDVARSTPSAVEDACPQIATALESDEPDTRANAAVAIGRVAAATADAVDPATEELLALLEDDHAHVRANACIALGRGEVEAARRRLERLASEDPNPNVRERAEWARDRVS